MYVFSGGLRPQSEPLVLLRKKVLFFLEAFALNRSKERACFSGGFRPHLELLVLMDMSNLRLLHVQVPTFVQFRTLRVWKCMFEIIST